VGDLAVRHLDSVVLQVPVIQHGYDALILATADGLSMLMLLLFK
jgi:hypothetical protein